jgi:hypothetical protein
MLQGASVAVGVISFASALYSFYFLAQLRRSELNVAFLLSFLSIRFQFFFVRLTPPNSFHFVLFLRRYTFAPSLFHHMTPN